MSKDGIVYFLMILNVNTYANNILDRSFPDYIKAEDMNEAMRRYPDLLDRLWRVCGVRIAVPLLLDAPTLQQLDQGQQGFVPCVIVHCHSSQGAQCCLQN